MGKKIKRGQKLSSSVRKRNRLAVQKSFQELLRQRSFYIQFRNRYPQHPYSQSFEYWFSASK